MTAERSPRTVWWLPLGQRPFLDTWELQRVLLEARRRREIPDLFLSVEHPHVITAGRSAEPAHVLDRRAPDGSGDVPLVEIERGGDVTYHGPGQLVGYFIFDLNGWDRDLHRFLRRVEEVQLRLLSACGIEAGRVAGKTGVWHGSRKLGSVGIAVRHWISYHGFALNVCTDPRFFNLIKPCGFSADVMTSVSDLLARRVEVAEVIRHLPAALSAALERPVVRVSEKRVAPVLHRP
jgi:lipoate-protein ligase B